MFVLILDTDRYSGEFERDMCAYITGQVGDCGGGGTIANDVEGDINHLTWFCNHIDHVDDSEGTYRPCQIETTPGYFNNGMGAHYKDDPDNYEQAKQESITALNNYYRPRVERLREMVTSGHYLSGFSEESCKREMTNIENTLNAAKDRPFAPQPAYMSVGINLNCLPPEPVLQEMLQRAKMFEEWYNAGHSPPLNVVGWRINQTKTITESIRGGYL